MTLDLVGSPQQPLGDTSRGQVPGPLYLVGLVDVGFMASEVFLLLLFLANCPACVQLAYRDCVLLALSESDLLLLLLFQAVSVCPRHRDAHALLSLSYQCLCPSQAPMGCVCGHLGTACCLCRCFSYSLAHIRPGGGLLLTLAAAIVASEGYREPVPDCPSLGACSGPCLISFSSQHALFFSTTSSEIVLSINHSVLCFSLLCVLFDFLILKIVL